MNQKRYPFRKSWRWSFVRLFDFVFDQFRNQNQKAEFPTAPIHILVIRLDHMGDLICSLPIFPILKRQYPQAKMTALVGEEGKVILENNPFIDQVILFRSNWFSRKRFFNPIECFRVLYDLQRTRFDLGFDLRGDMRNILLMVLAGVRYRVGYGIAGGDGLLHKSVCYDPLLHQVELNLRLVTDETVPKDGLKPEIYVTAEEKKDVFHRLEKMGIRKDARLIALHPEAGYPSKEWEEDQFVKLIQELLLTSENHILIFGLTRARQIAQRFSSSDRVTDLVGLLSLREMIAVLSFCHLFVGNDSGPSHLAQALGIPAVVIASGQNEYEKWGIWREPSKILQHEVPCSPCYLRNCNVEGHPCMSQISVEEVSQAAQALLAEVKS